MSFRIANSARTNAGLVRRNNEDSVEFRVPRDPKILSEYGSIYVVADGVGGNAKGEVASKLAVKGIIDYYYQGPLSISPDKRLKQAIEKVNELILKKADELHAPGMATTVTCAVILGNIAYVANVGDSRTYILNSKRKDQIKQITLDHSLVAEQIRRGILTEEEAKNAPNKNVITRALGTDLTVQVDLFRINLIEGDTLLLCTDGLVRVVSDNEIFNITSANSPESAIVQLVNLANKRGGPDNITVCIAQVQGAKVNAFVIAVPVALLLIAISAGIFLFGKYRKQYSQVLISITSTPSEAQVYIDNSLTSIGSTPLDDYKLAFGTHTITLKKDGYNDRTDTIEVKNGDKIVKEYQLAIKPKISIESNPDGALVYLDNGEESIGVTPIKEFEITPGKHTFTFKKEGCEDKKIPYEIKIGSGEKIEASLTPIKNGGWLSIDSVPSGADIYIDNIRINKITPLSKYALSEGEHKIKLTKLGYVDAFKTITIKKGEPANVPTIKLVKGPGLLHVKSVPAGAEIWIEGEDKKVVTPYDFRQLVPGKKYKITLKKEGYEDWSSTVTIERDKTTIKKSATLVKKEPSAKEECTVTITVSDSNLNDAKISVEREGKPFTKGEIENNSARFTISSEGKVTVKLEKEMEKEKAGYLIIPYSFDSKFGETIELIVFPLEIKTNFSEAKLFINDTNQTTPKEEDKGISLYVIAEKDMELTIKLEKEDYLPYVQTFKSPSTASKSVLEITLGFLTVDSKPSGARVYIYGNGEAISPSPQKTPITENKKLPLKVGNYILKISKAGYVDSESVHFEIKKGETYDLGTITLEEKEGTGGT